GIEGTRDGRTPNGTRESPLACCTLDERGRPVVRASEVVSEPHTQRSGVSGRPPAYSAALRARLGRHSSDALHRPDAEQVEAALNGAAGQVTQEQPAGAQGFRVGLEDGAVLEEAAVRLGQVPQVRGDRAGQV